MPKRETSQMLTCDNCGKSGRLIVRSSGAPGTAALRTSEGFSLLTTNRTWVRCSCGADVWFAPE